MLLIKQDVATLLDNLDISLKCNGEERQHAVTSDIDCKVDSRKLFYTFFLAFTDVFASAFNNGLLTFQCQIQSPLLFLSPLSLSLPPRCQRL
jgi:hypothetical protein